MLPRCDIANTLYPDKYVVKLMFWVTVGGTVAAMARDKCHADSFIHAIWSFEPEVVAAMSEALEAACKEQPNVARGTIAN